MIDQQTFSNNKILITGGLGFIGSNLARRLVQLGAHVTLVDSLIPEYGGNLFNIADIEDRVRVNISDVRDEHSMKHLVQGQDVLFNLAGQTSHMDSMLDPVTDLEINAKSQLYILEACRRYNPGVKIVFASTRQIYGKPDYLPVDEKHPLRPVDVNGINKLAGEWYHILYNNVYGIRACALRLTNTYGPRMRVKDARQTFLGIWIRLLLEGQPFEVWGGEQLRDFTYVDDAVNAMLLAAIHENANGMIYNIGGDCVVSLKGLADLLTSIACPTLGSCSANDLPTTVTNVIPVNGDTCEDPGDTIAVDVYLNWAPNANSRYDLGVFYATGGGNVNNGNACVGAIAPIGGGGVTPPGNVFQNLEPSQTGDICGDITSALPVTWAVRLTVQCLPNAQNNLVVNTCRVWSQNENTVCTNLGAAAGTGSKCLCEDQIITQVTVPFAATITVNKVIVPANDNGLFNLLIDNGAQANATNQGDGGTTGQVIVSAGTAASPSAVHTVGETAGTGTSLTDYYSSISCTNGTSTVGPVVGTQMNLTVQKDQNWVCTITNSSIPQAVTLSEFAATCNNDAIDVSWETSSELGNLGFNLFRGTSAAGPDTQLNSTLIPSQSPGSPQGFSYVWNDTPIAYGQTYYYWLDDVDFNNQSTRHGPVNALCEVPRPLRRAA